MALILPPSSTEKRSITAPATQPKQGKGTQHIVNCILNITLPSYFQIAVAGGTVSQWVKGTIIFLGVRRILTI